MDGTNQCARCGYTAEPDTRACLQYSDTASRLLKTNKSLTSVDEALIRQEMQRGSDMLASVDDEIAKLEAKIAGLERTRTEIKQYIDDHRIILSSPFRRITLPPEILAEIFHHVEPIVHTDVKQGIWPLGQVCSYWRSILLSSPLLWSNFRIYTYRTLPLPLVEGILSRSGESPLSFTLEIMGETRFDHLSFVISAVTRASYRWRRVALKAIPGSALPFLARAEGRVPLLTDLSYDGATFPQWLTDAPSLHTLFISSVRVSLSNLHIPWSQLRRCIVEPITPRCELELLRLCTNLEEYTFYNGRNEPGDELHLAAPSEFLCMTKLHTLKIAYNFNDGLLSKLILPSLTSAVLEGNILSQRNAPKLIALLSRSSCSLTTLTASYSEWLESRYNPWYNAQWEHKHISADLIRSAPLHNLTSLDVTCNAFGLFGDTGIVSILTIHPQDSSIVMPRLEEVSLHTVGHHSLLADAAYQSGMSLVNELARSRWHIAGEHMGTVSRLKYLELTTNQTYNIPQLRGALSPLLAFRDEGLDMDIESFYLDVGASYESALHRYFS